MKSRIWKSAYWLSLAMVVLILASACGGTAPETNPGQTSEAGELQSASLGSGEKLRVVATTNILGDIVSNVGSDRIELTTLMDVGVDPHSYIPTPADTAAIHDAHIVLANGLGLEADLDEILENAGGDAIHVHVSDGLELREADGQHDDGDHADNGHSIDPHVWFDVKNVIQWVGTIESALSTLDPANAQSYAQNASAYIQELEELDAWVVEQVSTIPQANRKLVTNHPAFGYLADRYGLEQLGAVFPVNPSSEPSAQEIAALEDAIREYAVPAVFTESTVSPRMAEQVAQDTGVKLVQLYSGSLGPPGSGAETYILLIRYDIKALTENLR